MKIIFVEKKLRIDKLGILYLSAVMRRSGHAVTLIQDDVDNAEAYLENNSVDFVMYSVMSGEHRWYLKRNKELKARFKFKSVMGGPHFTFFPEQGERDPDVDFVVIGPGEKAVLDILEDRGSSKVIKGTLPDVEALPEPDRSILYRYEEFGNAGMKRFIAGRDCPNACTYCFNHVYHKIFSDQKSKFFQRRSPAKMVAEIGHVRDSYPLRTVYFNDDDLATDRDWLLTFLSLYQSQIGLPFCGSVRANNLDPELVLNLKNAGCIFLNIALESANPQTQRMLRRGNISNKQVEDATRSLEGVGIKVRLQNIIGLPVDDPLGDALETFEFNRYLNPTDSWVAILQPFYGTDIWKHCLDRGLLNPDDDCLNFYETTPLRIQNRKEINNLHKWWYFAVRYKFPTEFLRILLMQDLSDDTRDQIQKYRWDLTAKEIYRI